MTQEDKELLLKDLCARLPYGIKCEIIRWSPDREMVFFRRNTSALKLTLDNFNHIMSDDCYEVKPYLFPLSSMTEEQKIELKQMEVSVNIYGTICFDSYDGFGDVIITTLDKSMQVTEWFNRNHFDYRGLIEEGLAIDATGLNIY